jgi:hypothetical protein
MPLSCQVAVEIHVVGLRRGDGPGRECGGLVVVLAGGQAVVEAAEEPAEEVALGGGVAVSGVAAAVVVAAASRLFLTLRSVTDLVLPLARVTGAAPTKGAGGAKCKLTPAQVTELEAVLDAGSGPAVTRTSAGRWPGSPISCGSGSGWSVQVPAGPGRSPRAGPGNRPLDRRSVDQLRVLAGIAGALARAGEKRSASRMAAATCAVGQWTAAAEPVLLLEPAVCQTPIRKLAEQR